MAIEANQKEIPPLSEIVKLSFKEVRDYIYDLSLPEVLIIGARPLDIAARPTSEIRKFSSVAKKRLSKLKTKRYNILLSIVNGLYSEECMEKCHISSYLEKYEFLISDTVTPPELLEKLDKNIRQDIQEYRNSIQSFRGNNKRVPKNLAELLRLKETLVDLEYSFHTRDTRKEPYLIGTKTKANVRIAGKMPYYMIKEYRKRQKGKIEGSKFKKYLDLEDGVIRDNVGLQFVIHSLDELAKLKEYIFKSEDIEVVENRDKKLLDDYYAERKGPYHAIHMDVVWNPGDKNKSLLFNPHIDTVEIILLEAPYFISSNFGPDSYWRRMNAQQMGIVEKNLKHGGLQIDKYTPAELEWKEMVENRIMSILTYGNLK